MHTNTHSFIAIDQGLSEGGATGGPSPADHLAVGQGLATSSHQLGHARRDGEVDILISAGRDIENTSSGFLTFLLLFFASS